MHQHQQASDTGKKSTLKVVWDIVFFFFYPVITAFSLLFVGVIYMFSSLSQLLSRLSPGKETVTEVKKPEWEPFVTCKSLEVKKLWVDEIMFGPAYYKLMTKPATTPVNSQYFGEFQFPCFGGVLLQKWNTTVAKDLPDFDLVFLDGKTGDLQRIDTVKAFSWSAEARDEDTVLVKWIAGSKEGEIKVHRQDLIHGEPLAAD